MPEAPTATANFDAAQAEADLVRTVVLGGETFTFRSPLPVGALAVFAMRLQDKNASAQIAAIPLLLRAWFIPEDHDRMLAYIETVPDLEAWSANELGAVVEAATGRPT